MRIYLQRPRVMYKRQVSNAQKAKALATLEDDVAKNIAKKWKKVKKSDSLAEILGLK